ncbi:SMI1/KNR4 family protein, partial [Flavobacterium chungangense]
MINKILETLKGDNDNKFFDGVSEAEINDFESKINVKLPDLLKKLYLEINGGYDGSLLEFYSLEKVKN